MAGYDVPLNIWVAGSCFLRSFSSQRRKDAKKKEPQRAQNSSLRLCEENFLELTTIA
jgi:hypothetical protein